MPQTDQYLPALRFRWLTPAYDVVVRLTTREKVFKHRLLDQASLQPGAQVLDLGCGTGTLALWAKHRQPETTVTGLDGDPQILAIAQKKASRSGLTIGFRHGLSDRLPFPDQTFDCVLSSLFFHHLQPAQKIASLLEVRRVLRPGGAVHIADWGRPTGALSRGLFYVVQLLDGFSNTQDHVAGRFPMLMKEAGFDGVEVRGTVATMYGTLNLFYGRSAGAAHVSP